MSQTISHHSALIYTMVIISAGDGAMSDAELEEIGGIVKKFPIFDDFDQNRLVPVAQECAEILDEDGGLEAAIGLIVEAIPDKLIETAYAVAVEVAVADHHLSQEELRLLEMLRHAFQLDRLYAGAIE